MRQSICPKVLNRVVCVPCGYPSSEARFSNKGKIAHGLFHKEKCDICGVISISVIKVGNKFLCGGLH